MPQQKPDRVSCLTREGIPTLPTLKGQIAATCSWFSFTCLGLVCTYVTYLLYCCREHGIHLYSHQLLHKFLAITQVGQVSFTPKWHSSVEAGLCLGFQCPVTPALGTQAWAASQFTSSTGWGCLWRATPVQGDKRCSVRNTLYLLKINGGGKEPPCVPAVDRYWGFRKVEIVKNQAQKTTHFQRQIVNWRELRESHYKD